jgi:hypothetical protein
LQFLLFLTNFEKIRKNLRREPFIGLSAKQTWAVGPLPPSAHLAHIHYLYKPPRPLDPATLIRPLSLSLTAAPPSLSCLATPSSLARAVSPTSPALPASKSAGRRLPHPPRRHSRAAPLPPPLAPHLVARSNGGARVVEADPAPRCLDVSAARHQRPGARGIDDPAARLQSGAASLRVLPLSISVCMYVYVCLYVCLRRRPIASSPAPAVANLGGGGVRWGWRAVVVAAAPARFPSLSVWRARVVAWWHNGGGVRRRRHAVGAATALAPFLFQKTPPPRANMASRRTFTERGTHGSRRRVLRRLQAAESASPRANSR